MAAAPAVEAAWASVAPKVEEVRRRLLGTAFDEYLAQVGPDTPGPFSS
jgi:hypothetical protein